MSRAVTGDHILFDESIDVFRSEDNNSSQFFSGKSSSFLLTSFELSDEWDLGICKVGPSIQVVLPGAYKAFISRVENPNWVGTHNPHLFGIALSSVVSFVTLKSCKSTRDDHLCHHTTLSEHDIQTLAIQHPILTAGPGSMHASFSKNKQSQLCGEIHSLITKLMCIDYKSYRVLMQSIRLLQLSILTKRDDFGLAYLLAVSSIESIAKKAIKRNKVRKRHSDEELWTEKAQNDTDFNNLLEEYRTARGKNEYLRERFVRFLMEFAPVESWLDYVKHPMQDMTEYIKEVSPEHNIDHIIQKNWFEKYPEDLSEKEIEKILSDAYAHRSIFVHQGEQPPHRDPTPTLNRFFQEYREFDGQNIKEKILPNHELLLGLSKNSIINWLDSK